MTAWWRRDPGLVGPADWLVVVTQATLRTMMSLSWLILEPLAMSIVGPHIVVTRLGDWRRLRYIGVLFTGLAVRAR